MAVVVLACKIDNLDFGLRGDAGVSIHGKQQLFVIQGHSQLRSWHREGTRVWLWLRLRFELHEAGDGWQAGGDACVEWGLLLGNWTVCCLLAPAQHMMTRYAIRTQRAS